MQELELTSEVSKWRSRPVRFLAGNWSQIKSCIPEFELIDFKASEDGIVNPYYKNVIRLPLTPTENRIPVGIVSNSYTLAQHSEVAELCIKGLKKCGILSSDFRCELGLSELGEWMNFRVYFPDEYNYIPGDNESLKLRLECFNSVDGNSRLIIVLGWLRFVCSNGMIIGETVTEINDIHNRNMDLYRITKLIGKAMKQVDIETKQLARWEETPLNYEVLKGWADTVIPKKWGKLAACRVYHICLTGHDVKYADPFEAALPSEKTVLKLDRVPGSREIAGNIYEVSQILSWIATNRNNAEEKTEWQMQIPELLGELMSA